MQQVLVEELQIGDKVNGAGWVEHISVKDTEVTVVFDHIASVVFPKGERVTIDRSFELGLGNYPVSSALYHWNRSSIPTPISGDKHYHNKEK